MVRNTHKKNRRRSEMDQKHHQHHITFMITPVVTASVQQNTRTSFIYYDMIHFLYSDTSLPKSIICRSHQMMDYRLGWWYKNPEIWSNITRKRTSLFRMLFSDFLPLFSSHIFLHTYPRVRLMSILNKSVTSCEHEMEMLTHSYHMVSVIFSYHSLSSISEGFGHFHRRLHSRIASTVVKIMSYMNQIRRGGKRETKYIRSGHVTVMFQNDKWSEEQMSERSTREKKRRSVKIEISHANQTWGTMMVCSHYKSCKTSHGINVNIFEKTTGMWILWNFEKRERGIMMMMSGKDDMKQWCDTICSRHEIITETHPMK